jgi:hypothetical protein
VRALLFRQHGEQQGTGSGYGSQHCPCSWKLAR